MRTEDIVIDPKWLEPVKLPNQAKIAEIFEDLERKQDNIHASILASDKIYKKLINNAVGTQDIYSPFSSSKLSDQVDALLSWPSKVEHLIHPSGMLIAEDLMVRRTGIDSYPMPSRDRIEKLQKVEGLLSPNSNFEFPNIIIRRSSQKECVGQENNQRNSTILSDRKNASNFLGDRHITESDIKYSLRRISPEQKELLIKIALATNNGEDKVRFSPSRCFASEHITSSMRATWSRCKKKLIKRGLILIEYEHQNILSKNNPGNSIVYVSLTALGCFAAEWLINCDS
jgi:hypothetical protein